MFDRIFELLIGVCGLAVTFGAGWLQIPHDRLGGMGVLVFSAGLILWAFRPRRRAS